MRSRNVIQQLLLYITLHAVGVYPSVRLISWLNVSNEKCNVIATLPAFAASFNGWLSGREFIYSNYANIRQDNREYGHRKITTSQNMRK